VRGIAPAKQMLLTTMPVIRYMDEVTSCSTREIGSFTSSTPNRSGLCHLALRC
jgi:hypothetical protein